MTQAYSRTRAADTMAAFAVGRATGGNGGPFPRATTGLSS